METLSESHVPSPAPALMRLPIRILILAAICATPPTTLLSQTQIEAHPCVAQKNQFVCDRDSFARVLASAKTVALESSRNDASSAQFEKFARALGKSVQPGSADLTFVLAPSDSDGIYFGPSDRELATLRVYDRASKNNPRQLLWVESYSGQPDTPWPTATHNLMEQFRHDFK